MAVSINALKTGDVVYAPRRQKMGHTTLTRLVHFPVKINGIDPELKFVFASINGNPPAKYWAKDGKFSWRRSRP